MAFSFRKIISNISYFTKSEDVECHETDVLDDVAVERRRQNYFASIPSSENIEFDRVEADSTSKCASLNLTETVRHYTVKKGSHSDTDLLTNTLNKQDKKKCRKLKLDIKKANQSASDSFIYSENSSVNIENTPKHKLLDCKSAELFRGFNFNQSFDLSDAESSSYEEENIDIESISDNSDTDMSIATNMDDKLAIKMCRKVDPEAEIAIPSVTPESFADVEVDKNDEERITLLLNYQMKFEKMESLLKKLLTEFQFHIEVSKIFNGKSIVSTLTGTDVSNKPKTLGAVMCADLPRGISPAWNIIMEKEDINTKTKLKTKLLSMRQTIDNFISTYLNEPKTQIRKHKISNKKKIKHYDFPDLREAMINLFQDEFNSSIDDLDCHCHCHSDSGLVTKSEKESNHSITSSIGNFSLDSTTLSAYSESLDQVISYNSFNDTSLYNTLLQRAAIERITFYIQVHSIQLRCESPNDPESKNVISFYCPTCKVTEYEENSLLKHILCQSHCEKIHFVYKTAYVKKCIGAGKEIQPSTVLNSMTMYRDENKIVCFGDAMYACSLCFENLIVGESVLMAHCSEDEHIDRRERLTEIFE